MGDQNSEVDSSENARPFVMGGTRVQVVNNVRSEKSDRYEKSGNHENPVSAAVSSLDHEEAQDQEDGAGAIENSVQRGKLIVRNHDCGLNLIDHHQAE